MVGQNKRCLDLQDVVFVLRLNFLLQNAAKSETCTLCPESKLDQLLNSHVDTFHMPNNPKLTLEKLKRGLCHPNQKDTKINDRDT